MNEFVDLWFEVERSDLWRNCGIINKEDLWGMCLLGGGYFRLHNLNGD